MPGLALTYAVFRNREVDVYERIALAFGLSLVVTIFTGFFLPYLSYLWFLAGYALFFMLVSPLIFLRFWQWNKNCRSDDEIRKYVSANSSRYSLDLLRKALVRQKIPENQIDYAIDDLPIRKRVMQAAIVCLIVLFTCFIVYSPHLDYGFPFHYDEWMHLKDTLKSIEKGQLIQDRAFSAHQESGFHMWLIPTIFMTGVDIISYLQYLPFLFMGFSSLALFVLLKRLTKSFSTAVFGMIIFASLKSNINVLGPWFFVPLTMAFPLIYLFFFSFVQGTKPGNEKFFVLAFVFLLSLFTIHFFSFLFIVPIVAFYLILNYRFVLRRWYIIAPTICLPLLGFFFTLTFFPQMGVAGIVKAVAGGYGIIYPPVWGIIGYAPTYRISIFYGILPFGLAVLGLFVSIRKFSIFSIWAISSGILFYLNMLVFLQDFLIPYLRLIYPFLLGMVPLSAIGLHWLILKIRKIRLNFVSSGLAAILVVALSVTTYMNYYDIPPNLDIYRFIHPEDIEALKYADSSVLSSVKIEKEGLDFFHLNNKIIHDDFLNIFQECNFIEERMLKQKTDYLLVKEQLDCGFIAPLYEGKARFLYKLSIG
jgi:hypothetical protein